MTNFSSDEELKKHNEEVHGLDVQEKQTLCQEKVKSLATDTTFLLLSLLLSAYLHYLISKINF